MLFCNITIADFLFGHIVLISKVKCTHILLIIIACFVSRLPLLLNSELILDGDECVVAMMAKNTFNGKDLSMFFYGQNYGFAFIEVLAILPFYLLLGFSTYAVKLAMLSLWITGVIFFYLALRQLATNYKWLALLIVLLLIVSPGWSVFSMKAYGGYITAFALSSIVLYLIFNERYAAKNGTCLWIGILLALIYQAHVLWLPGLLPFVAYMLYRKGGFKRIVLILAPLIVIVAAFYIHKQGLSKFNISGRFNPKDNLWEQLIRIPRFIYCTMNGHHELWLRGDAGVLCGAFAVVMVIITLFLPIAAIFYFLKARNKRWLFITSAVSIAFTLSHTIFTYHIQGKYLLPLIAYVLCSLFIFLAAFPFKRVVYSGLIALVVLGALCIVTFKIFHWPRTNPKDLTLTLNYLEKNSIRHVYSTQGMLAWQLIFYSGEKVIARPYKFPGRYEAYGKEIDSVLINGGHIAVVGYADSTFNEYEYPDGYVIGNMFIYIDPAKERLSKRFEFKVGEIFTPYK